MKHSPASTFALLAASALLAACQYTPPPQTASEAAAVQPPSLVGGVCGDCHAVEPAFASPNPDAPSFVAIANREGLTQNTLTRWLLDAHNYPELMDFELSEAEAQQVADYMLTLQRDDYVPEP